MSQEQINTHSSYTPRQFTRAIVESVVARHNGVTVDDVFGPSRKRHIINARFEAIAEVCEARPHWSYPTLGRLFGGRDHTSIMSALKKLKRKPARSNKRLSEADTMAAVRAVSTFIRDFEAFADQREYEAALSVAYFLGWHLLPAWARPEGGAQ